MVEPGTEHAAVSARSRLRPIRILGNLGECGMMKHFSEAEELAEAHDGRPPVRGVDPIGYPAIWIEGSTCTRTMRTSIAIRLPRRWSSEAARACVPSSI